MKETPEEEFLSVGTPRSPVPWQYVDHTFCASIAMYGEEENDFRAKMAEVARQAKQLQYPDRLVGFHDEKSMDHEGAHIPRAHIGRLLGSSRDQVRRGEGSQPIQATAVVVPLVGQRASC